MKQTQILKLMALAMIVGVGLAGCGGGGGGEETEAPPPGSEASVVTAPSSTSVGPPTTVIGPGVTVTTLDRQASGLEAATQAEALDRAQADANRIPLPPEMLSAIRIYLDARENAISYTQATPASWVDQAAQVMTPGLYAKNKSMAASGSPGEPWRVAHQMRFAVKTQLGVCSFKEMSPSDPVVICELTDTTVDATGKAVSASVLPFGWPYNGLVKPPPVLGMTNAGGKWLVRSDGLS